ASRPQGDRTHEATQAAVASGSGSHDDDRRGARHARNPGGAPPEPALVGRPARGPGAADPRADRGCDVHLAAEPPGAARVLALERKSLGGSCGTADVFVKPSY